MLGVNCRFLVLVIVITAQLAYGQPLPLEAQPEPAVTATLQLFDTYPVVGIGEMHSLKELGDFYIDLVSRPAFAKEVGNVVFEFGNAFFQPVVDRYLVGEDVPYEEVKKAWTTTIAADGIHEVSVMYGQFYEAVREANRTLPQGQKIKIWLGDPPADPDDPLAYTDERFPDRDAFFAETVLQEILAKNEKALLIIGAGHLMSDDSVANISEIESGQPYEYDVKAFIDAYYPDKLFVIQNHWGLSEPLCNRQLEAQLELGPMPSLTSLQGTALAEFLESPSCKPANLWGTLTGAWSDAYLYLGKSNELTVSPLPGEPEMSYMELIRKHALEELKGPE